MNAYTDDEKKEYRETIEKIKALIFIRDGLMKNRIVIGNKLGIKADGKDQKVERDWSKSTKDVLQGIYDNLKSQEDTVRTTIEKLVGKTDIWKLWFKKVKGIGKLSAGILIAYTDMDKAIHPSNLLKYAGLTPDSVGKKRGVKIAYSQLLKTKLLGVTGSCLTRSNSQYTLLYNNTKQRKYMLNLETIRYHNSTCDINDIIPEPPIDDKERLNWYNNKKILAKLNNNTINILTPLHIHNMANRTMVTGYVKDFWVYMKMLWSGDIRDPYMYEYLKKISHLPIVEADSIELPQHYIDACTSV